MRSGWSQRRAWTVWVLASLAGWVAIFALFAFWFNQDDSLIADDIDRSAPSDLAPAAETNGRTGSK